MSKKRRSSNLVNLFETDVSNNITVPAGLVLGSSVASSDDSAKVSSTSWVRAYVTGLSGASTSYVDTAIANLIATAPSTLDTLNELAAALGNDPSFATTVTNSIAAKVPNTRTITINGTAYDLSADRSWSIAAGVTSFNTRTGAITLSSSDVTSALGYTPLSSFTETDPTVPSHVKSITTTNISNWNTAYGWGNHAGLYPTYIGTGASGTWGINVTGNAGAAPVLTATGALTTQSGSGTLIHSFALTHPQTGLFPAGDNSNSILTVNRHPGDYYSQLGFSSNGNLYYRNFVNTAINTSQAWQTIWTNSNLTNLNQLFNGPGYISSYSETDTLASVTNRGSSTSQNITFTNGRKGLIGVYNASQTQAIFAMGADYVLADGGGSATIGNLYGLAWSYNPDYGGAGNNPQSKAGLNHQLLLMQNGITTAAFGSGIWTNGNISAANFSGTSSGTNTGDQTNISGNAATATNVTTQVDGVNVALYVRGQHYGSPGVNPLYDTGALGRNTLNMNQTFELGKAGFLDVWGATDATGMPPGCSHVQGVQSMHYLYGYGFQMAGQYDQDSMYIRQMNSTTYRAWRKIIDSGNIGSQSVSYATSAGNATTAGGLAVHTGTNNEANKIVRTEANGYVNFGWINTVSGDNGTTGINRIYASEDAYLRYYTPANFISVLGLITTSNFRSNLDGTYFHNLGFTGGGSDANTLSENRTAFTYSVNAPLTGCIAYFAASGYGIQLNGDYTGDSFSMRSRNGDNATWRPWKRLLTDYNYNNYSPTLTGGNASGTWGISISGNAATATLAGALTVNYNNDSNSEYQLLWGSGNGVYGTGGVTLNPYTNVVTATTFLGNLSGTATNATNGRLVYDDGAYSGGAAYREPSSMHVYYAYLGRLVYNNGAYSGSGWVEASDLGVRYANSANTANSATTAGSVSDGVYLSGTQTITGIKYFETNNNAYSGSTDSSRLQAFCTGGNSAFMSFHRSGNFATNFGLDADNVLRMGGWSAGANRWQLDMSGNMTVAGDVTAYSDARVKTNVKTIENALSKTVALRGVSYNRTDSADTRTKIGVIAQETMVIVPEVVNQDNAGMYNVSYGNLGGLFIEAIKELAADNKDLREQINELKKLIS